MTTESILTDDAIARILSKKYGYPVDEVFRADHSAARAIEQAVLQSEQVKAWREMANEYDQLIRHMCDGGDFHEFQRDRAAVMEQK